MSERLLRPALALLAVLLTLGCLAPLFRGGGGWIGPCVAAVLVAGACALVGRRLPLPALTGPVLSLLGGVVLMTVLFAGQDAVAGVIPGPTALLALRSLFSSGLTDVQTYGPPVPVTQGLELLTACGVYAVTLLVDLFTVTGRRPVLAGVPLLGLVAVPASFRPHGLGWFPLALAVAGWLALVAADTHVEQRSWGKRLGRAAGRGTTGWMAGAGAGRLGLAGLAGALVVPALVPALHGGLVHPSGHCCGGGSIRVENPLTTIDQELGDETPVQLLSVTTSSPDYLRFTALDAYTGNGFTLARSDGLNSRVDGTLPVDTPGLGPDVARRTTESVIAVGPTLGEHYLPLPYSPVSVRVSGTWQLSPAIRTIFSTSNTTAGLTFSVTSEQAQPSAAQLRAGGYRPADVSGGLAAQLQADLQVPTDLPRLLDQDVARVTRAAPTAYDKLLALQKWFTETGGFTYTLRPGLPAGNPGIDKFLTQRRGFCEQFATVFTLMARKLGVPTRVAVGFTPGMQTGDSTYLVDTTDAHAWPESWFDGVGWVRFEPTPRSGLGTQPAYLTGGATSPAPATPSAAATPTAAPPSPTRGRAPEPDAAAAPVSTTASAAGGGLSLTTVVVLAAIVALLLALLMPASLRVALRRRRLRLPTHGRRGNGRTGGSGDPRLGGGSVDRVDAATGAGVATEAGSSDSEALADAAAAHAAWAEILDSAADLGFAVPDSETPRATGRRLGRVLLGGEAEADRGANSPGAAGSPRFPPHPPGAASSSRSAVLVGDGAGAAPARGEAITGASSALGRLSAAEERARFGPPGTGALVPALTARQLVQDVAVVRRGLRSLTSTGSRIRAVLLPSSMLRRLGRWARFRGRSASRRRLRGSR